MRYLNLSKVNNQKIYTYKIADSEYQSDQGIDAFSSWRINDFNNFARAPTVTQQYSATSNLFREHASIGENTYDLCVDSIEPTGYLLSTKNQSYQIDKNSIHCNNRCKGCIDSTLLLGPVLILNLAMNGVYCLHASAFLLKDKVFILMGDSGTGKSTIARFMDKQSHVQRLSDDILPLKIIDNKLTVLPNFPQLKLPADKQYTGDAVVRDVVLLFAQKSVETTELIPIDTFSAIKFLIKHSVATKLFAKNELQNHLSFCHQTSAKVESYRLNYQHSTNSLNQLYNLLDEIV
ncbi:MAG: hypothetical protein L3J83_07920 [Proteobacteria bacterium]|nr:hypothetical protein [Pseudomonadota bacterium]